jgi:hypothetical protein
MDGCLYADTYRSIKMLIAGAAGPDFGTGDGITKEIVRFNSKPDSRAFILARGGPKASAALQVLGPTAGGVCSMQWCLQIIPFPRCTMVLGSFPPIAVVTPYPGRFCRELLYFDDFTAQILS